MLLAALGELVRGELAEGVGIEGGLEVLQRQRVLEDVDVGERVCGRGCGSGGGEDSKDSEDSEGISGGGGGEGSDDDEH